jgi:hypothetical protein
MPSGAPHGSRRTDFVPAAPCRCAHADLDTFDDVRHPAAAQTGCSTLRSDTAMALTQGHHVFAGLHEDAVNKVIRAFRLARPKYFFYACPPLGSGVPGIDFWVIPPLPIPGTNSGMPISVRIAEAHVEFTPAQSGLQLPPPLALGPNQFALLATIEVCFLCGALQKMPVPREEERERESHRPDPRQNEGRTHRDCTKLSIWAIGHPISTPNSQGGRDIGLHIDRILIREVGALESLLQCYSETMLNSLLDALRYPVERFALGAFGFLGLVDGPFIADNQLKVWADIS